MRYGVLVMFVLFTLLERGAAASDPVYSASSLAMGRTGVAAARDNVAISLNPGALALTERFDFSGSFAYGPYEGLHWTAAASDARTSDIMVIGIAYSGDNTEPPLTENDLPGWEADDVVITNVRRLHEFTGSFAVPLAGRRLGIGLSLFGSYFNHDRYGEGWAFDMHGGVGVRPTDWLTVGAATRHFIPAGGQDRDLTVVGGARVTADRLAAEADITLRPVSGGLPASVNTGAEVSLRTLRFRGGWILDEDQHSIVTTGAAWEVEGAALEYAIAIPLHDARWVTLVQQVGVRFGAAAPIPELY